MVTRTGPFAARPPSSCMSRATVPVFSLRPMTEADEPFLRALYAETRAREMDAAGWPEAMRAAFLRGQFDAQQRSYLQKYSGAAFSVVLVGGKRVGRLYVARLPEAVEVVEITLSAACRGRGWGTALLKNLLAEADGRGMPVYLHVDAQNRAQRLYRRLGFRETAREGFYLRMERPARGGSMPAT